MTLPAAALFRGGAVCGRGELLSRRGLALTLAVWVLLATAFDAVPITFNTVLPVTEGEGILRLQVNCPILKALDSPGLEGR